MPHAAAARAALWLGVQENFRLLASVMLVSLWADPPAASPLRRPPGYSSSRGLGQVGAGPDRDRVRLGPERPAISQIADRPLDHQVPYCFQANDGHIRS
eukprot:scaffold587_cov339-Prasinococcus_capsulatus_cf.AAC.14